MGLVVAYTWNREKQMFVALGKEFDMIPWERNWYELAFKYFIFKKRNYYFIANTQTNISKFATEGAKEKQVSYIPLKRSMAYDQGLRP